MQGIVRWNKRSTAAGLDAWQTYVAEQIRKRNLMTRVLDQMRRSSLCVCFAHWRSSVQEAQSLRIRELDWGGRRRRRRLQQMMREWYSRTSVRAGTRKIHARILRQRHARRVVEKRHQHLLCWRLRSQTAARMQDLMQKVLLRFRRALLGRGFESWCDLHAEAVLKKMEKERKQEREAWHIERESWENQISEREQEELDRKLHFQKEREDERAEWARQKEALTLELQQQRADTERERREHQDDMEKMMQTLTNERDQEQAHYERERARQMVERERESAEREQERNRERAAAERKMLHERERVAELWRSSRLRRLAKKLVSTLFCHWSATALAQACSIKVRLVSGFQTRT